MEVFVSMLVSVGVISYLSDKAKGLVIARGDDVVADLCKEPPNLCELRHKVASGSRDTEGRGHEVCICCSIVAHERSVDSLEGINDIPQKSLLAHLKVG